MNTPIKQAEGSTSVMAAHFLRDLQRHPPRPARHERDLVRKDLDALLPTAGTPAAQRKTLNPAKARGNPPSPKKDRSIWMASALVVSLVLAVVVLTAWSLRHAPSSTFWGGVGFMAALLGTAVVVVLWGTSGSNARDTRVDVLTSADDDDQDRPIPIFPVIGFDFLRYDELNPND